MGVEQYLMAFLFLSSYSLALSHFTEARWRVYASAGAATAAIAFAALTNPWEHGVLVVAFTLIGLGLFAAAAWALWAVLGWLHAEPAGLHEPHNAAPARPAVPPAP